MTTNKFSFLTLGAVLFTLCFSIPLTVLATTGLILPVHLTPANNSTTTSAAWKKATWTSATTTPASNATTTASSTIRYFFEISNASTTSTSTDSFGIFTSPESYISQSLDVPEVDTTGMPAGVWYWHVKATDTAIGTSTAWTSPWKIAVTGTPNTNPTGNDTNYTPNKPQTPTINDSSSFDTPSSDVGNGIAAASVGALASCSIGAILSRLISSTVGAAIQQISSYISGAITGYAKDLVTEKVKSLVAQPQVPTHDASVVIEATKQKSELRKITAKTTGSATADVDSVLSGFISSVSSISLDSIMFCVVNEILTYITQSTIQWINNGFHGNPVYVQNPSTMFQQIADRETANLANQIMGQAAKGVSRTIVGIAEPLKQGAIKSIIGSDDQNFQRSSASTLSPYMTQNYNRCLNQWCGFQGVMQMSTNNYYGTNRTVQDERNRRVLTEQANQDRQLGYSGGYRTPTTCPQIHKRSDGSCEPMYAQTNMPYRAIGDEVQSRSNMKYMRLTFAKDFDSVVTALVNQLVKIAVTKMYQSTSQQR